MGEHDKQRDVPKVYEQIGAENRFVELAKVVLEKIGETSEEGSSTGKQASWPQGDQGYHYELKTKQSRHVGAWGQVIPETIYILEHYIDELPADHPLVRYAVSIRTGHTSYITILDNDDKIKKVDEGVKLQAKSEALHILTSAVPAEAKQAMNDAFEYRFERLVGSYILSDFAVEGTNSTFKITKDVIIESLSDHIATVFSIEDDVRSESLKNDNPVMHAEIEARMITKRLPDHHGNYKAVDMLTAATNVANVLPYNRWAYTVPANTNNEVENTLAEEQYGEAA